jgi:lysosomal alpha-mannosidase
MEGFCFADCGWISMDGQYAVYKSQEFINSVKTQSKDYATNHLMATMGGDFHYSNAEQWFRNLDILIDSVNSMQNDVYVLYSTPNCYLEAVHKSNNSWNDIKDDDFFPYADRKDDFWSGYFSSRPTMKSYIIYANNILQVSKHLIVMSDIYSSAKQWIEPLQETVAITLHHDGITGTSKQFVIDDYMRMLDNAIFSSEDVIIVAFQKLMNTTLVPNFCLQLNISQCLETEKRFDENILQITIYNPLAHPLTHYFNFPITEPVFQIKDGMGRVIESQVCF